LTVIALTNLHEAAPGVLVDNVAIAGDPVLAR